MEIITKTLYWISTGLMIPVVVLLLIFFVQSLILVGTFYAASVQKIKFNKQLNPILETINTENVHEKLSDELLNAKLIFVHFVQKAIAKNHTPLYREKQLADFEMACQKDISRSQQLAKLGPVLGLMGTLIPMGPALVGLAAGDIASMASNMQVAFSTTVIGLLVGAIGFVVMQVKRRWYTIDMNNLEYISELMNEKEKTH